MNKQLNDMLGKRILLLDGAMGTMLLQNGLPVGKSSEIYNLTEPETVRRIHRAYLEAGSNIIYANTFGINSSKNAEYPMEELVSAGIKLAKEEAQRFGSLAALDVGPLGQLLEPMGTLPFEQAYALFREKMLAGEAAGADLIVIETMTDLYELKAAVLAAKENTSLPVFATMSFEKSGKTFTGTDVGAMAVMLDSLGVDAMGINCSLGPVEILPIAERLLSFTNTPLIVKANAGLPEGDSYSITQEEFVQTAAKFAQMGVSVLGGCCGTNPDYIRGLKETVGNAAVKSRTPVETDYFCSSSTVLPVNGAFAVGEFADGLDAAECSAALVSNDTEYFQDAALDCMDEEPDAIRLDFDRLGVQDDRGAALLVKEVAGITRVPLILSGSEPTLLERASRVYNGKCKLEYV